jgi:hypothetical protein
MNHRILLILFLIPAALGAQTLRFGTTPATVSGVYQLDSEVSLPQTMVIRERGAATSYFVTFSTGSSGSFTARTAKNGTKILQYQIYDNITNRNVLKDLSANPSLSEVLSGSFPTSAAWQTQNQSFTVYLLPGQLPSAAVYTDTITMSLYTGTPASHGAVQATKNFTVSITMNAALDIALVTTGAPFSVSSTSLPLDLGVLSSGSIVGGRDLMIRANSLNTVTVSSLNGGILKNTDLTDTSTVPYTLVVSGTTYTLGTPQTVVTSAAATTFSGTRYTLSVTVGTATWPTQGSYSDVLTLQAAAN